MSPYQEKKLASTKSVLREYWRVTMRYRGLLTMALGGMVVIQVGRVLAPYFLSNFITQIAQYTPSPEAAALLVLPLAFYIAFELLAWIGHRIEMWAGIQLAPRAMKDLTEQAYTHLMRHSYQFFSSNFAGALTRRVGRYSNAYDKLYDSITLSILPALLYIVGILAVLGSKSIALSLTLLGCVMFFITLQWFLIRWQQPLRRKRAEEDSNLTAALADSISNHGTVQLFSGNLFEDTLIEKAANRFKKALLRVWVSEWWIYGTLGLFGTAINALLLWMALQYWQTGALVVGDFVLIQIYLFRLMENIWNIGREFRSIFTAVADAAEMVAILEAPHDIRDKRGAKKLKVSKAEVWFDDVTFFFNDGTNVLNNFNLKIQGGEKIALVGPSGAGKTTVTKLLLRLYDVNEGEIKIDGEDIAKVTQDTLREAIGFVPQEPILFHRTLMENIRYGRRGATDEEVIEAAKKAHCHEFISKLPEQYGTYVGERGVKLSGGERQRVAIARAILKDAPILVLDEATSSLDSQSEALIQDAFETLMQGKTVVVIAHRLSTIMKMDRIVVVEGGAIAAQGTHLELVNQQGLYRKLWSIQAGGFIGDGHKPKEEDEKNVEEETDEFDEEDDKLAGEGKAQ
jgi:ATP-binding cassette subfamily B protein